MKYFFKSKRHKSSLQGKKRCLPERRAKHSYLQSTLPGERWHFQTYFPQCFPVAWVPCNAHRTILSTGNTVRCKHKWKLKTATRFIMYDRGNPELLWTCGWFFVLIFWDRVSLCGIGWSGGVYYVDQADLKHKDPPASASSVLALKAWPVVFWFLFVWFGVFSHL